MGKRLLVLLMLVVGCGDNAGPAGTATEPVCPPRPAALRPACSADGFCGSLPVSERPGRLSAITSAGCEFLLLDHLVGDAGTILRLGTGDTFGRIDTPVRPGQPNLDQLLAFSPTDIWAINDENPANPSEALHYDGAQWHVFPFYNSYLSRMWASPPADVWIARKDVQDGHGPGTKVDLEHWNGSAFVRVEPPDGFGPSTGAGLAPDDMWICGGNLADHFDGQSWTKHATGVDDCVAMFTTRGRVFLLGDRSVLSWDGAAWSPIYSEADTAVELSAIWGAAPDDLWVGGTRTGALGPSRGYLLHFDGAAWSPVAVAGAGIRAIHGTGRDDVLFGGDASYLTHWDGHAMTDLAGGQIVVREWQDLWGSGGTVWAVDFDGTLVTSAGDRWALSPGCDHCGTRITGSSPTDVWRFPSNQLSLPHFDGSQWSPVTVSAADAGAIDSVFAASPSDVWAVGRKETFSIPAFTAAVFHFDGTRWTELAGPPVRELFAVWGAGDDAWVSDGSVLFRRQADQWLPIDSTSIGGTGFIGNRMFGRSSNDVYFAGDFGLVRWDGSALKRIINNQSLLSVSGDATRVWITGRGGYLAIDDGTGFRPLDTGLSGDVVGAYFYAPAGAIDRAWVAGNQDTGNSVPSILEYRR